MKNFIKKKKYVFAMTVITAMACFSACSKAENVPEEKTEKFPEVQEESMEVPETSETEVVVKSDEITLEEFQAYVEELAKKVEEEAPVNGNDRGKAEEAFAKVNEQRVQNGVAKLVWDESLYELACVRAQEIVTNFSHQRPDGSYVGAVIIGQYGASGCGENIASNYRSIANLINGWLNSKEHKDAMLDSRFTSGAMGCYCHNGTYYWVNLFKQ